MAARGDPVPYRWAVLGVSMTVNTLAWAARSTFALFYVAMLGEFPGGARFDGPRLLTQLALFRRLRAARRLARCPGRGGQRLRPRSLDRHRHALVRAVARTLALLYRDPPNETGSAGTTHPAGSERTLPRALRSTRLWAALIMTALGVIGYQIMATHQGAHAVDRGFPYLTVVWLFAGGAGCTMAGNLLGGWLSERVGHGWVFALGSAVAIAGIGCLGLLRGPDDLALLVLYTISGVGFGMRIAQLSAIPADVFSGPPLSAILGVAHAGGGLGGAIGPFLGGWLFDVRGGYRLAFTAAGWGGQSTQMPILGHVPRDGAMSRDGPFTSAATSGNGSGSGVFPSISGNAPGSAGRGAALAGARLVPPEHARGSANTTEAPAIACD